MKRLEKLFITIFFISCTLILCTVKNYAVEVSNNETTNTTQNNVTSSENTTQNEINNQNITINTNNVQMTNTTQTNKNIVTINNNQNKTTNTNGNASTTSNTKSSNANLTTLGIKPAQYDFTGFNNATMEYSAKVPENIDSVEVFAKVQDSKATIEGTGKRTLEMGKNALDIIVTAEDGTKKTFTINVTRGEEIVDREGLKTLSIKNVTLSPTFEATTYEYTAKYIGEEEKLEITAEPAESNYVVEITGNENLQEGENVITILVSDGNGKNISTYQVTVDKSLIDTEAIAKKEAEAQANREKITIVGIIFAIIIVAIIVFIIIKHKRDSEILGEYSVVSMYDDDNNDSNDNNDKKDDYENEIPKALKNNKNIKYEESEESKEEDDKQYEEDYEEDYEEMPKEKIKEKFLNNYQNYEEEYDTDNSEARKKHKGKRFK